MKNNNEMLVYKSNKLIREARYSLTCFELQILNYIISQIDSPMYDTEFKEIKFSIASFCKLMGNSISGKTYKNFKNALKNLSDASMWIILPGEDKAAVVRWIERPVIDLKTGETIVKIDERLTPYLLDLKGYIKANLMYYLRMKSKYSMRLYDELKSWESIGTKEYALEDLKKRMDATSKSYDSYGTFKAKALNIAVNEINEITDLQVEYKERKIGRKINSIEFTIKKTQKNNLLTCQEKEKKKELTTLNLTEDEIIIKGLLEERNIPVNENEIKILEKEAEQRIEIGENDFEPINIKIIDYIISKADLLNNSKEGKEISNIYGWLLTAVKENWK